MLWLFLVLLCIIAYISVRISYAHPVGIIGSHFIVAGFITIWWAWGIATEPGFYDGALTIYGMVFYIVILNAIFL